MVIKMGARSEAMPVHHVWESACLQLSKKLLAMSKESGTKFNTSVQLCNNFKGGAKKVGKSLKRYFQELEGRNFSTMGIGGWSGVARM